MAGRQSLKCEKGVQKRSTLLCKSLKNREYLGSERPQTKFSEGGAFLVNWAVAPPG